MDRLKKLCRDYKKAVLELEEQEDIVKDLAIKEQSLALEYNKLSAQCIAMPIPDLPNLGQEQALELVGIFREKNRVRGELVTMEERREEAEKLLKKQFFVRVTKLRNDCLFQLAEMDIEKIFPEGDPDKYIEYDEGTLLAPEVDRRLERSNAEDDGDDGLEMRLVEKDSVTGDSNLDKAITTMIDEGKRIGSNIPAPALGNGYRRKKRASMKRFRTIQKKDIPQDTLDLLQGDETGE